MQKKWMSRIAARFDSLVGVAARMGSPLQTGVTEIDLSTHHRPVLLVAEVTADGRVVMAGTVARFDAKAQEMTYKHLFQYDISLPFSASPDGSTAALFIGRRQQVNCALQLLRALATQEPVFTSWPQVHCDANGRLFESFERLYGVDVQNPTAVTDCVIALPNPARRVLAEAGLEYTDLPDLPTTDIAAIKSLCKKKLGAVAEIMPDDFWAACVDTDTATVQVTVDVESAYAHGFRDAAVEAVKNSRVLTAWQRHSASWADAERAVQNPTQPLTLTRLSRPEVFIAADVEQSEGYNNVPLPDVRWRPQAVVVE